MIRCLVKLVYPKVGAEITQVAVNFLCERYRCQGYRFIKRHGLFLYFPDQFFPIAQLAVQCFIKRDQSCRRTASFNFGACIIYVIRHFAPFMPQFAYFADQRYTVWDYVVKQTGFFVCTQEYRVNILFRKITVEHPDFGEQSVPSFIIEPVYYIIGINQSHFRISVTSERFPFGDKIALVAG